MISPFRNIGRALLLGALGLCFTTAFSQKASPDDTEKAISARIKGLRALSDSDRVGATKKLALDIRKLPAGQAKVDLAEYLASRATEGDFGQGTLQEVTTTLAKSVSEHPVPKVKGELASVYIELAELERYEHMKIKLKSPDYDAALVKVDETDKARAKVDFTLTDLDGKAWSLSSLKGKIVVVNFWATWCPPCRKEMPDLQELAHQFKDQGLVILSISDEPDTTVRPFIVDHKYDYPILLDPNDKVNKLYSIEGIPKSFFYNKDGKLVAQSIDMRTKKQFLKLLEQAGIKN